MSGLGYNGPSEAATSLDALAERFRVFAFTEAEETSPLYHWLALAAAEDRELLALAARARAGQPPANLLFAAVHLLLLQGSDHPLSAYFAGITSHPLPPDAAAPVFRDFCLAYAPSISRIVATNLVQTNEVARCAYLLPAFSTVAQLVEGQPLALIEAGASAGLNLLFDRYHIRYWNGDQHLEAGAVESPVQIDTQLDTPHAARQSQIPLSLPAVAQRMGIDLHVVDLNDDAAFLWLRALIWPEHAQRTQRLLAARTLWRAQPPQLIEGDIVRDLPGLLSALPAGVAPVVFHTHVLNQFAPAEAAALEAIFKQFSHRRPIFRIGNDLGGGGGKRNLLRLRRYDDGFAAERILAAVDGHARHIAWTPG